MMHLDAIGTIIGLVLVLAVVLAVVGTIVGAVLGFIAWFRTGKTRASVARLEDRLAAIEKRMARLEEQGEQANPLPTAVADRVAASAAALAEPAGRVPAAGPRTEPPRPVRAPTPSPAAPTPGSPAAPTAPGPGVPRPPAPARPWLPHIEERVGARWLAWAGVVLLILTVGFFVRTMWSGLSPEIRVAIGVLLATGLLVGGDSCVRRRMRAFGQVLMGGGLGIFYVSLSAAFSLYHLPIMPQPAAFGCMVLVTTAGMTLALLHDAVAMSFIAVLGGFLTPILVRTGNDPRDALFAYLTLLDVGVMAVALFRHWRSVDTLAFLGTWALYVGWYLRFYQPPAMVPALLWVGLFFLVFLLLPFLYHLRCGSVVTIERFVMALANTSVACILAFRILGTDYRHTLGFLALGLAACYTVLGAVFRERLARDKRAVLGCLGLAVVFLTLAVPLHLRLYGITLVWAIEGPALLWLGYRYRYLPVRIAGFAVLVLATVRLFGVHWPLHDALFVPVWNARFAGPLCVAVAAGACAGIHWLSRKDSTIADVVARIASAQGAGFLAIVLLHEELREWLVLLDQRYLASCIGPLVWTLGCAVFVTCGVRMQSLASRISGLAALAICLLLAVVLPRPGPDGDYFVLLTARYVARWLAVIMVFAYASVLRSYADVCRTRGEQLTVMILHGVGVVALWALLSVKAYDYCIRLLPDPAQARWLALMSVSIVWAVYATALLVIGFARSSRAVRFAGLGLFGLTLLKALCVDIPALRGGYRVVGLCVVAVLLIAASYLYNRLGKRLASASEEPAR